MEKLILQNELTKSVIKYDFSARLDKSAENNLTTCFIFLVYVMLLIAHKRETYYLCFSCNPDAHSFLILRETGM